MKSENGTIPLNIDHLKSWVGRQEERFDEVTCVPVRAMSAMLNRQVPNDLASFTLPALWHWLYFLSLTASSNLAQDGHAKKGGFLPPVLLPRRMWAGGRLEFIAPLRVGDKIRRVSTISNVTHKTGSSGELVFVVLKHDIYCGEQCLLREFQDLVYREPSKTQDPPPRQVLPPATGLWSQSVEPTPTLLFRYSALTFNAHRIHYDRDYAIEVDGYEGLVVHGPLVATLLLELLLEMCPGAVINRFQYRGVRPLLATAPFDIEGCFAEPNPEGQAGGTGQKKVKLWAKNIDGWITMTAEALITG